MNDLQDVLGRENKDAYIIGDMNIDLLNFSNHRKTGDYLENIFSQGFLPLIVKPTRLTSHSATLIDHIYTNKLGINSTSGIVISDVSDHFGIFSIIKYAADTHSNIHKNKPYRSFSQTNINNFNMLLQNIDFTPVFQATCPDAAYNIFLKLYLESYDIAFPLKLNRTPRKYIKRLPWFTKGLVQSSITKSKLLRKKSQNATVNNISKYKTYASIFNKLVRNAKTSYYHEQLNLAKNNVKLTWTILNRAINKDNYNIDMPEEFVHKNITIKNKTQIATKFNQFFANIGSELSENVPLSNNRYTHYLKNPNGNSFFLDPVTQFDLINATNKIKTKNSLDQNNLSSKLMKSTIYNIANPLTHIINLSLSNGVVPSAMKIAKVIPIFKTGDRKLFTNYRPISILPVFSKILEILFGTS